MLKLGQFAILGLYLCNSELYHYPLEPPTYFKEERKGTLYITKHDKGDDKKVFSRLIQEGLELRWMSCTCYYLTEDMVKSRVLTSPI